MASGFANKVTGQIGEFLFCAEVGRQCSCVATPFAGNVPEFDVLVADDQCHTIPVQVKTIKSGDWQCANVEKYLEINFDEHNQTQTVVGLQNLRFPSLLYAFIWLKNKNEDADRYFLMTMCELQLIIQKNHIRFLNKHNGRRPKNWESLHCSVRRQDMESYEHNWHVIDEHLEAGNNFN